MGIKYEEHPKLFLSGFIIWLLLFIYMFIDIWLSNNRQNSYLNEIKNIKVNDVQSIEIFKVKREQKYSSETQIALINYDLLRVIKRRDIISNIIKSLSLTYIVGKTRGIHTKEYLIVLNLKNIKYLFWYIDNKNDTNSVFLFYFKNIYKNEFKDVSANLVLENKQLKSVLKELNLPNRKEKQASNGAN